MKPGSAHCDLELAHEVRQCPLRYAGDEDEEEDDEEKEKDSCYKIQ